MRISAFDSGGVHYTGTGGIIWFSELNQVLVGQEQRFIEAFLLEPRSLSERSLGRIELPFIAGDTRITKGVGCHVLRIESRIDSATPLEHRFLLFDDGDPIGSMRVLTGIEYVLFWDPHSQVFAVEKTAGASAGPATRAALDCSARVSVLDESLARRIAHVEPRGGQYWTAPSGDLLVNDPLYFHPEGQQRVLLIRGTDLTTFSPVLRCFELDACAAVLRIRPRMVAFR